MQQFPMTVAGTSSMAAPSERLLAPAAGPRSQTVATWRDPPASPAVDQGWLVPILSRSAGASSLTASLLTLASELHAWLRCERIYVVLVRGPGRVRIAAVSQLASFDRQAPLIAAAEEAAREALLGPPLEYIATSLDSGRAPNLARFAQLAGGLAWRVPWSDAAGRIVAVCLVVMSSTAAVDDPRVPRLGECHEALGNHVRLLTDAYEPLWRRGARRSLEMVARFGARRAFWLAAALLFGAAWVPWPYRVACPCTVEPVVRRFVAAPFDGTLERSFARPGDRVAAGQVLARLDGRELQTRLAALQAQLDQARKRHEAALGKHDASAAQLAEMETQQTEREVQLLEHRQRNLEVRSPIAGIVLSGDLQRAEGVPLTVGQRLFEVAPLDRMIVEAAVPEHAVADVRAGQRVQLTLQSLPGTKLRGEVARVHPQAELRNLDMVFVAEMEVADADAMLLPGMSGTARIDVAGRPLAWILFHRAWEAARGHIGW